MLYIYFQLYPCFICIDYSYKIVNNDFFLIYTHLKYVKFIPCYSA